MLRNCAANSGRNAELDPLSNRVIVARGRGLSCYMTERKRKKLDIGPILVELEKCKRIDSDGKIFFEGWPIVELYPTLEQAIDFPASLPEGERRRIMREALRTAAAKSPLNTTAFLGEIKRLTHAFANTQPKPFILATSISLPLSVKISPIRLDGGLIVFSLMLPRRFSRERLAGEFRINSLQPNPPNYQYVRVQVNARSTSEGFNRSKETLEYVRALWNFQLNRPIAINLGNRSPLNKIRLGQVHTLHQASGELAAGEYLYEPSYTLERNPAVTEWNTVDRFRPKLHRLVSKCPYKTELRKGLIRYGCALDLSDHESAFIKLWSVLELLTASEGRHDDVVRRCSFLCDDVEIYRLILHQLRERRNDIVHSSLESTRTSQMLFQLRRFVETLIGFHMRNSVYFKDLAEASQFLHLPPEPSQLKNRISQYRRALRYRISVHHDN